MFSIYENNKKISGACHSFVLCLDYVAISLFICFKKFTIYMCHSWRGKTQGHLVPTMNDTYNATINFKKYITKTQNGKNKTANKIKTKTKEITTPQENDTEKRNRLKPKKVCLHRVNIVGMLRKLMEPPSFFDERNYSFQNHSV